MNSQEAFNILVPELLRAAACLRSEGRRFLPGCWQCGGDLNAKECVSCRKFFHFARDLRFTGGDAGLDTSIIDKTIAEIGGKADGR